MAPDLDAHRIVLHNSYMVRQGRPDGLDDGGAVCPHRHAQYGETVDEGAVVGRSGITVCDRGAGSSAMTIGRTVWMTVGGGRPTLHESLFQWFPT